MRIETKIINNLIFNEEFCRKAAPHIKPEYFSERLESIVVKEILKFFNQYNKLVTPDILKIELDKADITDKELNELNKLVDSFSSDDMPLDWLIDNTEKFCLDRSVYNAILKSIKVIEGKEQSVS